MDRSAEFMFNRLPQRTNGTMDVLTDILLQAGLRRRLLDLRRLSATRALRFPCDRSLGLHVVTQGQVHVHAPTLKKPLTLNAGDIALMARGCNHVLSTGPELRGMKIESVISALFDPTAPAAAASEYAVISGAYQFWNAPVHPFFAQMPDWFVLRGEQIPRLGPLSLTVALLKEELGRRDLGGATIVHGLFDVIFTYVTRELVADQGRSGAGWSHAVRDPQVRHALGLMHDDCAYPWTLDELAQRTAVSRSSLAERFRAAMGDTPLNYLRAVRMQKAMRVLSETTKNLEQVAQEVGYQDAFGFSKVFKRTVGVAPKEFRRQDAAERDVPWRIGLA
jgi:AraC-like DNA-binding protein